MNFSSARRKISHCKVKRKDWSIDALTLYKGLDSIKYVTASEMQILS